MKKWKKVIEPKTGLLDLHLEEIWQYRSLIYMLAKRNYEVQYKQTILGMLWMFITPILSSGVFTFVFGNVGGFSTDGMPQFFFYLSGNILWTLFSSCVNYNVNIFLNNAYIFGKVYFPRLTVPLANSIYNVIKFSFSLLILLVVWGYFLFTGEISWPGVKILLQLLSVLLVTVLGTAIGLIISSVTTKYRDFAVLVSFGLQLLMYASPVVYPMSQLPEKAKALIGVNPIAPMLEMFRYAFTGGGEISLSGIIYSISITFILLFIGLIMYNQTEKTFIDVV